ncbi:MAG: glycosyltransferase [Roseivivax sp.]|nr:glycosyltransferase [Roseivivax sp.]
MDPAWHYVRIGAVVGRDPGPAFSTKGYLGRYGDVARKRWNPLVHFEIHGRDEGRKPVPATAPAPAPMPDAARPAVDVVVPVFNALPDVQACLRSLAEARTGCTIRVLVVNDGSDAETGAWLREAVRTLGTDTVRYELFEHDGNKGYTVAVNTGLKASKAPYVVTLNSDTIVTPNWLDGLIRCMRSSPEIGITGPLSNAASWQNVPDLYGDDGAFAINPLPNGMSAADMARVVFGASARDYPRTTFVNGFCFMIRRAVIDAIGYMDEAAFPTGYGEENDFCIRAQDAGFALAYADDTYVFHAKSKSFGSERRVALSKAGGEALRAKHTAEKFARLVAEVEKTGPMDRVRARIKAALASCTPAPAAAPADRDTALRDAHQRAVKAAEGLVLSPAPSYSPKGYNLAPGFAGASIVLPYAPTTGAPANVPALDIGVHLHLHYPDLADEFIRYLGNIPTAFHLYVSVPDAALVDGLAARFAAGLPRAKVTVRSFENRGRDIGPWLAGFGAQMKAHDYVCHIHSKRSPHNPGKKDWRSQLMGNLMGSPSIVAEVFRLFDKNPQLGMVFPEYHWSLSGQISWGTNYDVCEPLARRMGLSVSRSRLDLFPAGSMFWARGAALKRLFDLNLTFADFPPEQAQVDGTTAHAVERLLGTIAVQSGFRLQQVRSSKPYDLVSYFTASWPYSGKSGEEMNRVVQAYRAAHVEGAATVGLISANAGGYDVVPAHEALDPDVDYHLVADLPTNDSGYLKIHPFPSDGGANSTGKARGIKTNPFAYLDRYEVGIWIDANVMIRESLEPLIRLARDNPQIPVFGIPHPQRNCLYEEAQAVISHNKADPARVQAQVKKYADEGYPKHHGLIETNLMVLNLRHPQIRALFDLWRREVSEQTHRDQLSLNYALWKLGLDWMPLMQEGKNLRTEPQFAYFGHRDNSGYRPVQIDGARVIDPSAQTEQTTAKVLINA